MFYEVIIAGAGPAGLSTALFLLKGRPELKGRVLVLERKVFPREKFCAGALGARGDRLLQSIGVDVDVPSVPISRIQFTAPGRSASSSPGTIGRVIRRREFDARLAEIARKRGAVIAEGLRVTDFRASLDRVDVEAGGEEFSGAVLVGADGVGSVVRRRLGLPFGRLRAQAIEVDTERIPSDTANNVLHFDVSDRALRGYGWDFPTPLGGEVLVSRGIYSLEIPGDSGRDVQEYLRRRLKRLGLDLGQYRVKRMAERGFEPHQPFSSRRVLLVGEAAGVDPLTGEGIAEAIQYGALAGPYLARKTEIGDLELTDWKTHFLKSSLGSDLLFRRWLALLCFRLARRPAEALFARAPGVLTLATGLFAGRFPYWRA
jgi:flavin-dependent dehydrogenase